MDDIDKKHDLLIHVIIGASDFAKIKTQTMLSIGKSGEPVTIMSPGHEPVSTYALLTSN